MMTEPMEAVAPMTVEMLGAYILIQRDKPQERVTPGGIVLPAKTSVDPAWATVRAVGVEAACVVSPGDRIMVSRFAGSDVKVGDEQLHVVSLDDVFGVDRGVG